MLQLRGHCYARFGKKLLAKTSQSPLGSLQRHGSHWVHFEIEASFLPLLSRLVDSLQRLIRVLDTQNPFTIIGNYFKRTSDYKGFVEFARFPRKRHQFPALVTRIFDCVPVLWGLSYLSGIKTYLLDNLKGAEAPLVLKNFHFSTTAGTYCLPPSGLCSIVGPSLHITMLP